jgi:DNA-binding ferritin-like protein
MKKIADAQPQKLLALYVAFLRALYLIHQNSHWQCKGPNFYGNHLMFQRIYESVQEDSDLAAEKSVGLFGNDVVNIPSQSKMIQKLMEKYSSDNHLANSLKAEMDFLALSKKIYEALDSSGALTLGLDDAIMSIASNRETAVFLLKQAGAAEEK